jgi:4-hydroxybenzoate polyprenyltransferase
VLRKYLELVRFSHTLFAMPFALLAAVMAAYANLTEEPECPMKLRAFAGIVLCMVFARSAAMAFNRFADRKIDAENPRTAARHLPANKLTPRSVFVFTVLCSLGFIGGTLLFLPENPIPVLMSVPVLAFLFGYSYAKRFTVLVHWWLGTSLMLAPLAAWTALRPVFSPAPVFLGLAVLFWAAGFDILYALLDEEFDRRKKLFSVPGRFGTRSALLTVRFSHVLMMIFLGLAAESYAPFGRIFQCSVVLIGLVLIAEHCLVRPNDPQRVNLVFFGLNIFVSLTLLIAGVADILL